MEWFIEVVAVTETGLLCCMEGVLKQESCIETFSTRCSGLIKQVHYTFGFSANTTMKNEDKRHRLYTWNAIVPKLYDVFFQHLFILSGCWSFPCLPQQGWRSTELCGPKSSSYVFLPEDQSFYGLLIGSRSRPSLHDILFNYSFWLICCRDIKSKRYSGCCV